MNQLKHLYLQIQLQSQQCCILTLQPQQSSPSQLQKGLLFISSHKPSDIHFVCPPACTKKMLNNSSFQENQRLGLFKRAFNLNRKNAKKIKIAVLQRLQAKDQGPRANDRGLRAKVCILEGEQKSIQNHTLKYSQGKKYSRKGYFLKTHTLIFCKTYIHKCH